MRAMVNSMADSKQVTLKELLSNTELRWPLLITVLLILSQQFSGINAVNLSFQFDTLLFSFYFLCLKGVFLFGRDIQEREHTRGQAAVRDLVHWSSDIRNCDHVHGADRSTGPPCTHSRANYDHDC